MCDTLTREYFPEGAMHTRDHSLLVRNIVDMALGSVGSRAYQHYYIQTTNNTIVDVLKGGTLSCAVVVSRILVAFKPSEILAFCNGPHTTVSGLIRDLVKCGWYDIPITERRAGSVVLWEHVRGNEHIGIGVSRHTVVSNCRVRKVPVLHRWTTETDNSTKRLIVRMLWHPFFDH